MQVKIETIDLEHDDMLLNLHGPEAMLPLKVIISVEGIEGSHRLTDAQHHVLS